MNTENQVVATATETKRIGRPTVEGSKRQAQLAARAERVANGAEIKRGRPSSGTSKQAIKMQERAERIARGEKVGPGRPKVKVETPATDETVTA
jgi:hypothetical protein